VAAIDDDLDLPTALASVRDALRADLPADERRWLILDADLVLGLDLDRDLAGGLPDAAVPDEIGELVAQRAEARSGRDFARSDDLRRQLGDAGYDVRDTREGQTIRRR
jgi:cysteinyl-tRNA synthetase